MAVPKQKTPRSRQGSRLANKGLQLKTLSKCPKCNEPIRPHMACLQCGFYKGKEVIKVETLLDRKKRQEKRDSHVNK